MPLTGNHSWQQASRLLAALLLLLPGTPPLAAAVQLVIARENIRIDDQQAQKITLNGQLPGPTLHFKEDEQAEITVTNHLDVPSSIHWHGLLLPGAMDGVPGLNGFHGIAPGQSFTYRFPLRQAGTYWYHAHSQLQEQDGLYGSLVIAPGTATAPEPERDYVVLLSEFHPDSPETILHKLKAIPGYYNSSRRTLVDLFTTARRDGWRAALADRKAWGEMRMDPTDLADVGGYTFLVNGKSPQANWTGLFTPGERVRLRVINAAAMSFFDFRIPGLKLEVVAADGREVKPVSVDEFRIGPAETYDVIVTPGSAPAYSIAAEALDRSGMALATLAVHEGLRADRPQPRRRSELTMADMGMAHAGASHDMAAMDDMPDMPGMPGMPGMQHDKHEAAAAASPAKPGGWADADTPEGQRALRYEDLESLHGQSDVRAPERDVLIRLTGNMERYSWTLNGKPEREAEPLRLRQGERVRLKFVNETMMAHPMHLHGMFVQLENGRAAAAMPDKHTLVVPPGGSLSVLLSVTEPGEWALHCHLLYHMASGMMSKVVVDRLDAAPDSATNTAQPAAAPAMPSGGHAHDHH